ncbi:MAG: TIM barrel protein [Cytophagales bacterium]|nr:TIM barrel protein [Cytophagales bacterium]
MDLGISTYTFTWAIGVSGHIPEVPMNIYALIDKALQYKVDSVQIADNIPLHTFTMQELSNLKQYAISKNIKIEIGTRGFTYENTLQYLKITKFFGSPFLRMVIDEKEYEPSLQAVKKLITQIIPYFEQENIILAFENHDRFKALEFEEMMHSTDTKHLGICLDSVNSMGGGEGFREVCDTLLPYTINLHIKDFHIQRVFHRMGIEILGTPAGKGMLDIPLLINKSKKYNKVQSAILELWTPMLQDIPQTIVLENDWANDSISYLKKIIS